MSLNETPAVAGYPLGHQMLKFSLVVLFVMSMATLTIAASALPVPPETASRSSIALADLG